MIIISLDLDIERACSNQGSWTRADRYAILTPVLLRWEIIRRNVCIAVVY